MCKLLPFLEIKLIHVKMEVRLNVCKHHIGGLRTGYEYLNRQTASVLSL